MPETIRIRYRENQPDRICCAGREALTADPRAQSVVDEFGLLGDPAIQVPFEGAGIP
jgi:hypothetical protein